MVKTRLCRSNSFRRCVDECALINISGSISPSSASWLTVVLYREISFPGMVVSTTPRNTTTARIICILRMIDARRNSTRTITRNAIMAPREPCGT